MSKLHERRLCSAHFKNTTFASHRRIRLRPNACPSVPVTDPRLKELLPPARPSSLPRTVTSLQEEAQVEPHLARPSSPLPTAASLQEEAQVEPNLGKKNSWIPKWQFLSPRRPHTVRGWQITINAVLLLWEDLSLNFDFDHLLARRLSQDPLENLFGLVRQQHGCNETPNSYQFVASLRHIFLGKMLQLSSRGNCEAGAATLLVELRHLPVSAAASHQPEPLTAIETDELDVPDESYDDHSQENVEYHFAGFLVESFLKKMFVPSLPGLVECCK
ncbi:hypothetical protein ISCGN_014923 [Ixodes scapularis]